MGRSRDLWRLVNLPCRGMTQLASRALDHDLDRVERAALQIHLLSCASCRRFSHQIRVITRALRGVAGDRDVAPTPGPAMPDQVRDRIKRRLSREASLRSGGDDRANDAGDHGPASPHDPRPA